MEDYFQVDFTSLSAMEARFSTYMEALGCAKDNLGNSAEDGKRSE
jgi:hypothetical protein